MGAQRARLSGGSGELHGLATLLQAPDHRRIDIRASSRDPFGQLWFRTFRQRGVSPVAVLADLSRSMRFRGRVHKLALVAEFTRSAAYSAYRAGDPFGFMGCDEQLRQDYLLTPSWRLADADALAGRITDWQPVGASAEGLLDAAALIANKRALVFLVSDFYFPDDLLQRLLDRLSRHRLVPVVVWDSAEYRDLPKRGLAWVQDPETGRSRFLLLRADLNQRIEHAYGQRWKRLQLLCQQHACEPFLLQDEFDADALTRYFYG